MQKKVDIARKDLYRILGFSQQVQLPDYFIATTRDIQDVAVLCMYIRIQN